MVSEGICSGKPILESWKSPQKEPQKVSGRSVEISYVARSGTEIQGWKRFMAPRKCQDGVKGYMQWETNFSELEITTEGATESLRALSRDFICSEVWH